MKFGRSLVAMVVLLGAGAAAPKRAEADEWNKRTFLTFSKDVELSGTVLPAGTYTFQLADSQTSRHVVQVFDDKGRILTTALTIPTSRRTSSDNTRIAFEETPAGSRHSIKAWFYPGCVDGEEFLRPNRSKPATTD